MLNTASIEAERSPVAPLVAGAGKSLAHYVLFGAADQPATHVNLLLARDFLLAFAPAFGFSQGEAANASAISIIADVDAVPVAVEDVLVSGGARVQRIAGDPVAVAEALRRRVQHGQAF
jgi:hypothetical protein